MKRRDLQRSGRPASDLLEEAVRLLRAAPPTAWLAYFAGTVPGMLGALYFISDMSRSAYAAEQPSRRRVNLWPVLQSAGGLVLACFVFYTIGRMLLALPDSFHDGSMWEMDFITTSGEEDP